jgi:hypothetical protein
VLDFASPRLRQPQRHADRQTRNDRGSFASLSNFSDNLFLGFLAKEINNFVSNLAEQSGGPELLFSAALCLGSGDLLCGDARMSILSGDSLNQLARRFNTTAERLKDLNPAITNWARIRSGQRVVVLAPAG